MNLKRGVEGVGGSRREKNGVWEGFGGRGGEGGSVEATHVMIGGGHSGRWAQAATGTPIGGLRQRQTLQQEGGQQGKAWLVENCFFIFK